MSPQGDKALLSLDIYYLQSSPKGLCSAYRLSKTVLLLARQKVSVDHAPAASPAAATGTVCKIRVWQVGDNRERAQIVHIPPTKNKQH